MNPVPLRVFPIGFGGLSMLSILAVCTGCRALLLAAECSATVSGTLHTTKDRGAEVEYIFRVDARTHASCGKINAVLKVWESDGGGVKEIADPRRGEAPPQRTR